MYDQITLQPPEIVEIPSSRSNEALRSRADAVVVISLEWDFRGEKLAILQASVPSVTLWNASTRERSKYALPPGRTHSSATTRDTWATLATCITCRHAVLMWLWTECGRVGWIPT